jgi:hypothetical protein
MTEWGTAQFGFTDKEWKAAKEEARELLIAKAKVHGDTITYLDLASQITSISVEAHDQRLFHLIGEVAREEDAAGHGLLSVLVVHKHGDKRPGEGFFELAEELGRDISDTDECWVKELQKVHDCWGT